MAELSKPEFISRDPQTITAEAIAYYEGQTGKALQPAQPERLQINTVAYRETVTRIDIQLAAEQNLVHYATGSALDHLGELVACARLEASAAQCAGLIVLTEALAVDLIVAAGARCSAADTIEFVTAADVTIAAGETEAACTLSASVAGSEANGYIAGQIEGPLDPIAHVALITNTAQSWGGAAEESDDRYRLRIMDAPETFSIAGPIGAYRARAMSTHQDITDVAAVSTYPGVMAIYPLTSAGAPTQEIKDLVLAALDYETVVPGCDQVVVFDPTRIEYAITAEVTLYSSADEATVQTKVTAVLNSHAAKLRSKLGQDIIMSQISGLISAVYGVYKVVLTAPATDQTLAANEWADCTGITVNYVGYVNA